MLEDTQKKLDDYLKTKRMGFPRFYFLSNDELLEILAQTRNVQAVQPHMIKCFDAIKALDFGSDPKSVQIFAMISPEGENVTLGKNLKARGNVEKWLSDVESEMQINLRKLAKVTLVDHDTGGNERTEWASEHPAQLIIMVSQIHWCRLCTACFTGPRDQIRKSQQEVLQVTVTQLRDMCLLVREKLAKVVRCKIVALVTIDVHNRDIVEELLEKSILKENDFGWQVRLRL